MAIFLLTITVQNIQAGRAVSIAFSEGVATWTLQVPGARAPGFSIDSIPAGQLALASMSIDETGLTLVAGSSAGSVILQLHVAVPEGMTTASGATCTGGDTDVNLTWSTASGLQGELMGDWTIVLE